MTGCLGMMASRSKQNDESLATETAPYIQSYKSVFLGEGRGRGSREKETENVRSWVWIIEIHKMGVTITLSRPD